MTDQPTEETTAAETVAAGPDPQPAAGGPGKVKVRVTMFADPIDVDPGEIPALRGQGLLVEDPDGRPVERTAP